MNIHIFKAKGISLLPFLILISFLLFSFTTEVSAQSRKVKKVVSKKKKVVVKKIVSQDLKNLPKITQIDIAELKNLLKPNGKPILLNFWATWCEPCVKEFPDLIKIDEMYRGKIDFYTISMDDLSEIDQDVPKFLGKMNAKMPSFLLKTQDESSAVSLVSKNWHGGLPFTVLLDENGVEFFSKNGIVKLNVLQNKIDNLLRK